MKSLDNMIKILYQCNTLLLSIAVNSVDFQFLLFEQSEVSMGTGHRSVLKIPPEYVWMAETDPNLCLGILQVIP